ncbi:MAG: hypothetical protein LAP21_21785 [Acidobacteriia bacterium]|nr:hypothetical protein [Terriglobia bacterium]
MTGKASRLLACFFAIFVISALPALAQTNLNEDQGMKPYDSWHGGDLDSVSMTSGGLVLHIPLASFPQRGNLDLSFSVRYSSKQWKQKLVRNHNAIWVPVPNSGTQIVSSVDWWMQGSSSAVTDPNTGTTEYQWSRSVTSPDGATHLLGGGNSGSSPLFPLRSLDATGLLYTDSATLIMPNGTRYSYPNFAETAGPNGPVQGVQPSTITDANGNRITVNSSGWTDTLGRLIPGSVPVINLQTPPMQPGVPTVDLTTCPAATSSALVWVVSGVDTANSVGGLSNGTRTFKFCYSMVTLNTAFAAGTTTEYGPGSVSMLTAVVLPDLTMWTLAYDNYGDITRLGFPTGGSISYTYNFGPGVTCNSEITQKSMWVASRTVDANDGTGGHTWTYNFGTFGQAVVTSPDGNDTVHTITNPVPGTDCSPFETQTRYFQGSAAGGTLLKTVQTQYSGNLGLATATNVVPTQATVTLASGLSSKTVNTYDTAVANGDGTLAIIGSLLEKDEYDFTNTLVRSTLNHYLWQDNATYKSNNFVSLAVSSTTKDGAGNQVAQSTAAYDEVAVTSSGLVTPSLVLPPAGGNVRGNQTTSSRWLNPGNTVISSNATYFDTGMKASSTDPLQHQTSYTYASSFLGAYMTQTNLPDTQMPDTGAPIVHHIVSGNYDFNTGLLVSFTDENSQTFTYKYDNMLRLGEGDHPDGGQTIFTYPDPLTVTRQRLITNTPSTVFDSYTAKFDGLGRPVQTQQVTPSGTVLADTTYDVMGRASTVSNPYYQGSNHAADPTYGITQTIYDALSRTTRTIKQDGSASTASYNQSSAFLTNVDCTTAVDEAGKLRKTCSDALGRLVEVDEPNPGAVATTATGSVTISGSEQTGNTTVSIAVANPGFETPALGSGASAYQYHPAGSSWAFGPNSGFDANGVIVGGSGITGNNSGFTSSNPPAPEGAQVAFLQGGPANFISQSLSGFQAGVNYTVSFLAAQRGNFNAGGQDFDVYIDATLLGTFRPASTSYALLATPAFTTTAGAHTLKFVGRDSAGGNGNAAFLDAVQVTGTVGTADSGTVSITINGTPYSTPYGSGDTASAIAGRLATAINAGSVATAVAAGATVNLTSKTAGSAGNYTLATAYTWNTALFTNPSFTSSPSGATLTGGMDPGALNNNPYVTLYTYDTLNNLLCVEQHGAVTGTGCSANPSSDATSPWRVRRFTYDSLSRLLTTKNPEAGQLSYAYDNASRVISKTEPAPNQPWGSTQTVFVNYTYDALNRPLDITYTGSATQNSSYRYDYTSFLGQTFTNPIGRQVAATAAGNTVNYFITSYDSMGRVKQTVQCTPGVAVCQTFNAAYDLVGDMLTLGYPNGFSVTYGYDSAARLTSATDSSGNIYAQTPTILASGAMQEFTSPNFSNFKFHTDFNNRLQPTEIWAGSAPGASSLFDKTYQYNPAGLSQVNNGNIYTVTNVKDDTRTQSFGYDALNRLATAGDKAHWSNGYVYDPWGNLLQKVPGVPAGESLLKTADVNNHLSGLTYDAAGNTINDGFNSYTFDAENRITAVGTGASYMYDAFGRRVKKTVSSAVTNYWYGPGGQVLAESDAAGAFTNYVFFGGQRLARNISGDIKYYVTDHLHSTAVFADKSGTVLDDNDFYPWGGVVPGVGLSNSTNRYKFTGKERDSESGLDDFGARYYSSVIGRFMSPDWAGKPTAIPYSEFGNPQSLNLYSYVRNNPMNLFDPDGHEDKSTEKKNPDGSTTKTTTHKDNPVPRKHFLGAVGGTQVWATVTITTGTITIETTDARGNNVPQRSCTAAFTDTTTSVNGEVVKSEHEEHLQNGNSYTAYRGCVDRALVGNVVDEMNSMVKGKIKGGKPPQWNPNGGSGPEDMLGPKLPEVSPVDVLNAGISGWQKAAFSCFQIYPLAALDKDFNDFEPSSLEPSWLDKLLQIPPH